ncbi:MAG TPA: two-component regulator propeller domain-containing protein, partial [Marinilabiliaceae bacterium]|nr:two-component regulator propeller domain-containing protein [Marinilabiliaceae bacterium]
MKINSSYYFLILFFIQLLSNDIHANELPMYGIPGIVNFNRQNYKAGTQNWKITQADNGLIYSSNNDGVLEYDGTFWRLLPNSKMGLSRSVFAFEKRVYCGGFNEIGYFESNGINDLEYTSLINANSLGELGDIWNIFLFNDKIVFQADKGIIQYDYRNENILLIPARFRITTAFLVNGLFLLHDEAVGLMELRGSEIYEVTGGDLFAGHGIGTILPLSTKELLIGTISNGIYVWDHNGFKVWDTPASKYLNDANVFCGVTYRNDELAFGTIQSGVVITDGEGNIKSMVNKDRGLNNNTVLCLFPDIEGNLWAGLDNGIAYLTYNSSINFVQDYYDIGTGYAVSFLNNDIYFGTNQGLYHIDYDKFCDPLKLKTDFVRIQEMSGQVWSLFTDKEQSLLCGHNNGIFEISPTFRQISPSSVKGAWIFRYPPKRNNLLIVGTYNGLVLLKASKNRWEFVKTIDGFNLSSRFMEWDKEGRLWISHGSLGLYRLTFTDDFEELVHVEDISAAAKLPEGLTFNLTASKEGLLFSSKNGIYGYDDNSKS